MLTLLLTFLRSTLPYHRITKLQYLRAVLLLAMIFYEDAVLPQTGWSRFWTAHTLLSPTSIGKYYYTTTFRTTNIYVTLSYEWVWYLCMKQYEIFMKSRIFFCITMVVHFYSHVRTSFSCQTQFDFEWIKIVNCKILNIQ